jgi:hypothetical protein
MKAGEVIDWAIITDAQMRAADKGLRWRLARWAMFNVERGAVIEQSVDYLAGKTSWVAVYRPTDADTMERRRAWARRLEREARIDANLNVGRPTYAWLT